MAPQKCLVIWTIKSFMVLPGAARDQAAGPSSAARQISATLTLDELSPGASIFRVSSVLMRASA
jgi:hypothetical protein